MASDTNLMHLLKGPHSCCVEVDCRGGCRRQRIKLWRGHQWLGERWQHSGWKEVGRFSANSCTVCTPCRGHVTIKVRWRCQQRAGNKPPGGAGLKQRAGRVGRGLCGRGHTCAEALGTVLPGVSEDVSQCGWWRTGLVACWAVRANSRWGRKAASEWGVSLG